MRRNRRKVVTGLGLASGTVLILVVTARFDQPAQIAPAAYVPLLNVIAEAESKGNYNAYFGHTANSKILFTNMTVAQVLAWQADYVQQGNYSNAVGRYQIVQGTLEGLVQRLDIDRNAKFDAALQDRLAISLLERRGSEEFADNELSQQQFAANLAQEWASLPKAVGPNPEESYYADDGVNKSLVGVDTVYGALVGLEHRK